MQEWSKGATGQMYIAAAKATLGIPSLVVQHARRQAVQILLELPRGSTGVCAQCATTEASYTRQWHTSATPYTHLSGTSIRNCSRCSTRTCTPDITQPPHDPPKV
jgi:LSD1 subclass zinc finger protein